MKPRQLKLFGDPFEYDPDYTHLLFVYGTMKRGFRNHHRVEGSDFLGTFTTADTYCMRCKRLQREGLAPVVVPLGSEHIRGELYLIDGATMALIDQFEGHPRLYKREKVWLNRYDQSVNMYTYGFNGQTRLVSDGVRIHQKIAEFVVRG